MPEISLPKEPTFHMPAPIWKRALALVIDLIILDVIIGMPFRKILEKYTPKGGISENLAYLESNPQAVIAFSAAIIFIGLLALLYFAVLEYRLGQSLGKMMLGLTVVSASGKITFFRSLVRNMYLIFIFPFSLLIIVDPVFMIFSKEHRRLSEVLSRTKTVEITALR